VGGCNGCGGLLELTVWGLDGLCNYCDGFGVKL
jgi:hypothetical protein